MTAQSPTDILADLWRPWLSATLAPQQLWQSINSGWSFGNVTINEQNSSAPQTEQAILAEESYGRQIGKLLDAVSALAGKQPDARSNKAYVEVAALKKKVDGLKTAAAVKRIGQLRRDLELLGTSTKDSDKAAYREMLTALRTLIDEIDGMPA